MVGAVAGDFVSPCRQSHQLIADLGGVFGHREEGDLGPLAVLVEKSSEGRQPAGRRLRFGQRVSENGHTVVPVLDIDGETHGGPGRPLCFGPTRPPVEPGRGGPARRAARGGSASAPGMDGAVDAPQALHHQVLGEGGDDVVLALLSEPASPLFIAQ